MIKYIAEINIMPLKELLDPQGKAVNGSLHKLNLTEITDVRIGKHVVLHVIAPNKETAEQVVAEACTKLLANRVMETFEFTVTEA
jgi:phosphoribosylformylglycinamidine synthase subunit PurS